MARAIGLWAEAWTIPGTGPGLATKKVAFIPNTEHEWLDPLSEVGRGGFSIPAADDSLPLILDPENDVYSMIRIRRPDGTFGGAHVYSWLARRFEDRESDREVDLANITGAGLEELLKVPVLPFDYPRIDEDGRSFDPDWEWGSPDNKIRNPGIEDPGESIENPSFEDGLIDPWWAGSVDGVSATATVLSTGGHTGPNYARITPLLPEGGFSTSVEIYPNSDYEFTAWVRADIGKRYQVGAAGPEGIRATGPATAVVEEYPGYTGGFEAHYDFLGNGAFQLVTLNFRSAPSQTSTVISIRDLTSPVDLQPFDVDDVSILGIGIGMAPWEPTHPANVVSTFEVSQLVTPFEGDYHGHIVSLQYGGGKQKIAGVGAGETWTFTVHLQGLVGGHLWGIEIKDKTGKIIAQEVQALTGPGTWDELTITTRMPDKLPDGEVELWVVNHHTAVSTAYLDGTSFYHGLPPATYGDIMKTLLDDLSLNHAPGFEALTFLKYDSFDETDDSNSTPWVSTHSYKAEVGKTILNVMEDFAQRGYESRVLDLDGTDLTFDVELVIYEPEGLGTDASTDESIALVAGTNVLPTEIVRSAPVANDVTVQGADRLIVRVEDAASIAATQRIGAYVSAPELTGIQSVTERANQELATRKVPVSIRPTVLESADHTTPYYEFGVGWKVTCIFPPKVPVQARRIMSIAGKWSAEDEVAIFDIDTDRRVFASNPMLGLTRAVDILWRKFQGRTRVPEIIPPATPPGAIASVPTILVAPLDGARDTSWAGAHYRCSGVEDDLVIQEAVDELESLGGGRLVLAEGVFHWGNTGVIVTKNNIQIMGMGQEATKIIAEEAVDYFFQIGEDVAEDRTVSLVDFTLDGNSLAVECISSPSQQGSRNRIIMERLEVRGATSHGIGLFRPAGELWIRACFIHENGGAGVGNREIRTSIYHSLISDNGGSGLVLDQMSYVRIMGNHIEGNGGDGLSVSNALSAGTTGTLVVGNVFENNDDYGIQIQDGVGWVIGTNLFDNNGLGSIGLGAGGFGTATDIFIEGNQQIGAGTFVTVSSGSDALIGLNVVNGVLQTGSEFAELYQTNTSEFSQGGVLVTGLGSFKLPFTVDAQLVDVKCAVGVAPVGAAIIVDVNKNGTSIYPTSAKPQIAAGSVVGAAAAPDTTAMAEGDYLTVDIDQVGSTTPGEDLVVVVEWRPV